MPLPDYQSLMLPLLRYLEDKNIHSTKEITTAVSDVFKLTQEEREKLLSSGNEAIINNRVRWAKWYMEKAGLLEIPARGLTKISNRGLEVLKKNPEKIDSDFLKQFPEFVDSLEKKKELVKTDDKVITEAEERISEELTPDDMMERGYSSIRAELSQELLSKFRGESSDFFEAAVLKLLENMGYGQGRVTGRSGDGGIDGFVNQDKLGLGTIYFQAKRYAENNTVPIREIRDFIGALEVKGTNKGVFITTSKFSGDAQDTISRTSKTIVLIDKVKLAQLLIDFDVGVETEKTYKLKRLDPDFFSE